MFYTQDKNGNIIGTEERHYWKTDDGFEKISEAEYVKRMRERLFPGVDFDSVDWAKLEKEQFPDGIPGIGIFYATGRPYPSEIELIMQWSMYYKKQPEACPLYQDLQPVYEPGCYY